MKYQTSTSYPYDEYRSRVPWWWDTAPFWSSLFAFGAGMLNGLGIIFLTGVMIPTGIVMAVQLHWLWWIPTVMLIAWVLANVYVLIIALCRESVGDSYAIDEYHELPRKIRRSRRAQAKAVDSGNFNLQHKWRDVVLGYHDELVKPALTNEYKNVSELLDLHLDTLKKNKEAKQQEEAVIAELLKKFPTGLDND